jgi:predicted enzyme related to lactoylglutathione lyase
MYKRPADNKIHTYDCTIQVTDLDKTIKEVRKNGGTITSEKMMIPGVGWFAGALDTEGNKVGLMQPTEWEAK